MTRRAQENIVVLLLLAFFFAVLTTSFGFSPRARLVPIPIASLAILLLVFQLVWQNFRSADELNVDILDVLTTRGSGSIQANTEAAEKEAIEKESEDAVWRRILIAVGFIVLLVTMVLLIGPLPATFIFTLAYFTLSGHFSRTRAAAYATVFAAAVYLVFFEILNIQPYHGFLKPVVEVLRGL